MVSGSMDDNEDLEEEEEEEEDEEEEEFGEYRQNHYRTSQHLHPQNLEGGGEEELEEDDDEDDEDDDEIQSKAPPSHTNGPLSAPSPSIQTLTLALPVQHPRTSNGGGGGGGAVGREDCWSEGATAALIDAWGERYLELSRGNLKQKHWMDVADVVNSRDDYTKPAKTDVQCKNRIDTIKKKFKAEKAKISSGGGGLSKWPFYSRLEHLIGGSGGGPTRKPIPTSLSPVSVAPLKIRPGQPAFKHNRHRPIPQPAPDSPLNSGGGAPETSDSFPPQTITKKRRMERGEAAAASAPTIQGRKSSLRELTHAIMKIGDVYEKVERSKLQQIAELEKKRMGFAKELELQRMQFFMKTQLELAQMEQGRAGNSNISNNTG